MRTTTAAISALAAGSTVALTILTEDYIQSIQDVSIAFGLNPGKNAVKNELGNLLGSKYLGPDESNVTHNITAHVAIPAGLPQGEATLTAFLFSLEGAAYGHVVSTFVVDVEVGKSTSTGLVTSS